jgi:hypothetical protein
MGWSGKPPPPDPRVGQAIENESKLAREQFDWTKTAYDRDYLPAIKEDAALRRELQDAYLGSMRKQDEYADYQFGRYKQFAGLEDELLTEAKRGIDVDGRVGRAVADFSQQSGRRDQQLMREIRRNNMGDGSAMAYAMAANKNADALGAAGLATNIRVGAEGEDFARKAAVAGMGRGLVMDTGNFMQGANAAGGAAGNNSAQGMGIMNQGNQFMRGGYGMSGDMYGNAGNLAMGLSNYNMQGYQAKQRLYGDIAGAVGTFAGLKFADGGEVDSDGYDPQTLAEEQVNAAMGYKNGGSVARRPPKVRPGATTQRGGKVSGPGGPKDDRVPALLSDGEFVLPVGTVRKYGLAKLEKMRQDGLQFEKQLGIGRA